MRHIENLEEFKLLDRVANEETTPEDAVQQIINITMAAYASHGMDAKQGVEGVSYNLGRCL